MEKKNLSHMTLTEREAYKNSIRVERICSICQCPIKFNMAKSRSSNKTVEALAADPFNWIHVKIEKAVSVVGFHFIEFEEPNDAAS